MQLSIEIDEQLYNEAIRSGVDMQSEFNEYLRSELEGNTYLNSAQFQEDRADLQKIHKEIKSGEVKLMPFDEDLETLDDFIDNV